MVTACDIRFATKDVSFWYFLLFVPVDFKRCVCVCVCFSVKETEVAIVADVGTLHRIVRVASRSMAYYMALTGNSVGAEEAKQSGLVSHVNNQKYLNSFFKKIKHP